MPVQVGDSLPDAVFKIQTDDGIKELTTADVFAGKTIAFFALPGAFTPTCNAAHLPGYVVHYDEFIAKGADNVVCLSVNDAFVMHAWQRASNAEKLLMLADGGAVFTRAIGMDLDLTEAGMGVRSKRYSMLVKDGVVTHLNVEAPRAFEVSDAETLLDQL